MTEPLGELTVPEVLSLTAFVKGPVSRLCKEAIETATREDHLWCANRNYKETHCDCPCHWSIEKAIARMEP